MKVGIAPDSFKGSLTALQAADCVEKGLKKALKGISVVKIPMADGGDGTVQTIVEATGGKIVRRTVSNPLGKRIRSSFGVSGDGKTAVIEMAAASGLALLSPRERNPMKTSTRGTGELIGHALKLKAKHILVGIGGSATNDGGTGMARALGVRFLDAKGRDIPEGGGFLDRLDRIDMSGLNAGIADTRIEVACDVDNPLTGPRGASRVYGPQKGADALMVKELDRNLGRLARIIRRDIGVDILKASGSGAAGGLGAGLMAFVGGKLRPGIDMVIDTVKLEKKLKGCSLVITGEGRMDGQTAFGKAPAGVAKVAVKLGIPVIAIAGSLGDDVEAVRTVGIEAYFSALQELMTEEDLPGRGCGMLENCAEQLGRLMNVTRMLEKNWEK